MTRLPGKHTTPKEDDQEYILTSPNGESAPLSSLKTYLVGNSLVNNQTQVVHAGPDISMHRLSLGMRVKELAIFCIGIIPIVAGPPTWTIVTLIAHIIRSSEELHGTLSQKLMMSPKK